MLWSSVARTVTPLPGKKIAGIDPPDADTAPERDKARPLDRAQREIPYVPERRRAAPAPSAIDHPTRRKIARGRISIDATLDLHDLSRDEAYRRLRAFLHTAHATGLRHVLVITGKGTAQGGVLRLSVPAWLGTAPFRELVSGFDIAARHHGGSGAIYVRLRRRRNLP